MRFSRCTVVFLLASAGLVNAQTGEQCKAVLQLGTLETSSSSKTTDYSAVYNRFCKTSDSWKSASSSSQDKGGLGIFDDWINLSYKGARASTDASKFWEYVCSDIKQGHFSDSQMEQKLKRATAETVEMYKTCIARPGLYMVPVYTEDEYRSFKVQVWYIPSMTEDPVAWVFKPQTNGSGLDYDARAIDSCKNMPDAGDKVESNAAYEFSCTLKDKWTGSVSLGVKLKQDKFFGRGRELSLADAFKVPQPLAPAPAAAKLPAVLYLQEAAATNPQTANVGDWIKLEMAQDGAFTNQGLYKLSTKAFTLRIEDPTNTLEAEDKLIFGRMFTNQFRSGVDGPTETSAPAVPLIVGKPVDGVPTATFRSFDRQVNNRGTPPKGVLTGSGVLQIDATRAKNIGMQERWSGNPECQLDPQTTMPGGEKLQQDIPYMPAHFPKDSMKSCVLHLRLCAMPSYPLYNSSNSCTEPLLPLRAP